jgi:DNA-3-methyladenine glycosylase II
MADNLVISLKIHETLVATSKGFSKQLAAALEQVGPVPTQSSDGHDLGDFLSRAIVGQQLSATAARSIWGRITTAAVAAKAGVPQLAQESPTALLDCGVSANKLKALQAVRTAERNGVLREHELCALEPGELANRLMRIWGIGPWTSDMAMIFYFRMPDIWPLGDVAVQRTFKDLIGRRNPTTTADKFSPYRSYLALSMWRVVDGDS